MTALPANLIVVGEDLARATHRDAQRSARKRRLVTYSIAFALVLVLSATAAVANGWLFDDDTPALNAVPGLGETGGTTTRTLLTGLGPEQRTLTSQATAGGGVCLTLTGFEPHCVPTFHAGQEITWFVLSPSGGTTTLIWGIVRDEVTRVDAVSGDGRTATAQLANDAFYVEIPGGPPARLVVQLASGGTKTVTFSPCPPTTPNCAQ